jgi:hypothetical protein
MTRDVLVRAMNNEPKHLIAVDSDDRLMFVANPLSLERLRDGLTEPVGVPREDVFEFDAALAERISADHSQWASARRLNRT